MPATRSSAAPVEMIRQWIAEGRYRDGQFLPPIRKLSRACGVSPETVRRGLKYLEDEGLVSSEPRQGFRVRGQPRLVSGDCPVAYVTDYVADLSDAQPANWAISRALNKAAALGGGATLGVHVGERNGQRILEQLRAARAWGAVLDTLSRALLKTLRRTGLPLVMVNSWFEDAGMDVVLQDNYLGGFLAARHLVESGARRIAWIGPLGEFCHSRERFAGAVGGLAVRGRFFAPELLLDTMQEGAPAALRALLSGARRPDAALVFAPDAAQLVKRLADELGLEIERDLHVVGWTVEECHESEHRARYAGGAIPPAVVWKAQGMAEAALQKLDEKRKGKQGEALRILVPTRLRFA